MLSFEGLSGSEAALTAISSTDLGWSSLVNNILSTEFSLIIRETLPGRKYATLVSVKEYISFPEEDFRKRTASGQHFRKLSSIRRRIPAFICTQVSLTSQTPPDGTTTHCRSPNCGVEKAGFEKSHDLTYMS